MNMNKVWRQAKSGRFRFIVQSHQTKEVFTSGEILLKWQSCRPFDQQAIRGANQGILPEKIVVYRASVLRQANSVKVWHVWLMTVTVASVSIAARPWGLSWWQQSATGSIFGQDVLLRFQMHNYGIAARVQLQLQGNHAVLPRRCQNLSLHTRGCCLVRWVLMIWTLCMQR